MSNYDFRDTDPLWVRYAEYIGTTNGVQHNKFYEVRIDLADDGLFVTTNRWGPRPDIGRGQIKTSQNATLDYAQIAATDKFNAKLAKGYREVERPPAANLRVEQDWND